MHENMKVGEETEGQMETKFPSPLIFLSFILPLCLLLLSGFPRCVLVKEEVSVLCVSRAWAEPGPHSQLLLVLWAGDALGQMQVTHWALVWSSSGLLK